MSRRLVPGSISLLAVAAALVAATTAASRTRSGEVSVKPERVIALPYWSANGIQTYQLVTRATWSPATIRNEGAIYIRSCGPGPSGRCSPVGSPDVKSFGSFGTTPITADSYAGVLAAAPGDRFSITARWRAYTPTAASPFDGEATSAPTILNVPDRLPPRFDEVTKLYLADAGILMYASCASVSSFNFSGGGSASVPGLAGPIEALGELQCGSAGAPSQIANDPVDPNFRSIAKPTILRLRRQPPGAGSARPPRRRSTSSSPPR